MRAVLAALSVVLLAACHDTPPPPPQEQLNFSTSTYTFNVANVTVTQDYHSSRRPPNVEYLADISPAQAVKQWAGVKLIAAGHTNSMEVNIKDASILLTVLPKQTSGIEGMFTTEQTERYDGSLEVEMKIYDPRSALPVAHLNVKAQRRLSLPENATAVDRERLYHSMTIDLMKEIEPELDANIRRYLGNYLM